MRLFFRFTWWVIRWSLLMALIGFVAITLTIAVAFAVAQLVTTWPVGRAQRRANRRWAAATPQQLADQLGWP